MVNIYEQRGIIQPKPMVGSLDEYKQRAAQQAIQYVEDGMVLGLGTGSTTAFFIDLLAEHLQTGIIKNVLAVPTSTATAVRAQELNIPLTSLARRPRLDLAVDGADEVDSDLNLIKGLGRALLREKIVEIHADRLVIIVDETKIVSRLGQGPLPVEVATFEVDAHVFWLNTLGCRAELWHELDGSPVVTDNGNHLVRCWFEEGIEDVYKLARVLSDRPGILEHGLFLDMASQIVVGGADGVRVIERT
jgi:ribose 5-phosphate isomerase A